MACLGAKKSLDLNLWYNLPLEIRVNILDLLPGDNLFLLHELKTTPITEQIAKKVFDAFYRNALERFNYSRIPKRLLGPTRKDVRFLKNLAIFDSYPDQTKNILKPHFDRHVDRLQQLFFKEALEEEKKLYEELKNGETTQKELEWQLKILNFEKTIQMPVVQVKHHFFYHEIAHVKNCHISIPAEDKRTIPMSALLIILFLSIKNDLCTIPLYCQPHPSLKKREYNKIFSVLLQSYPEMYNEKKQLQGITISRFWQNQCPLLEQ